MTELGFLTAVLRIVSLVAVTFGKYPIKWRVNFTTLPHIYRQTYRLIVVIQYNMLVVVNGLFAHVKILAGYKYLTPFTCV